MSTLDIAAVRNWLFLSLGWLAALVCMPALGAEPQAGDAPQPPAAPRSSPTPPAVESEEDILLRRAQQLYGQGQFAGALTAYQHLLAFRQAEYGPDRYPDGHPAIVRAFLHIGMCHRQLRDHARRLWWSQQALAMVRGLDEGELLVHGLQDVAWAQLQLQRFDDAEESLREAEHACERLAPSTPASTRRSLLANIRRTQGELKAARGQLPLATTLLAESVELCEENHHDVEWRSVLTFLDGERDACYEGAARSLILLTSKQGLYDEALRHAERLHTHLSDSTLDGRDNNREFERAINLRMLGELYERVGKHQLAALRLTAAISVLTPLSDSHYRDAKEHSVMCYTRLANALHCLSRYAEAELAFDEAIKEAEALTRLRSSTGTRELSATSHHQYGTLLLELGRVEDATLHLTTALRLRRVNVAKTTHPSLQQFVASTLHSLASLSITTGDFGEAVTLQREAHQILSDIYRSAKQPNGHADLAVSLQALGTSLELLGDYGASVDAFSESIRLWETLVEGTSSNNKRSLAVAYDQLGNAYRLLGNTPKAEAQFSKSTKLLALIYPCAEFPAGHPDILLSLLRRTRLARQTGDLDGAAKLSREAGQMARHLYPPSTFPLGHDNLATAIQEEAHSQWSTGDCSRAGTLSVEAYNMRLDIAKAILPGMPDSQVLAYTRDKLEVPCTMIRCAQSIQSMRREIYDLLRKRRGLVQRLLRERTLLLSTGEHPRLQSLLAERKTISRQIGILLRNGTTGLSQELASDLYRRKDSADREIAAAIGIGQMDFATATAESISETLPADAAFIDIVTYKLSDVRGSQPEDAYGAFVSTGNGTIEFVDLGPANPIESEVVRFRSVITGERSYASGTTIRKLLWDPLAAYLPANVSTIKLCVDGCLSALPWAAIPDRINGAPLVARYTFVLVPHGQQPSKSAGQDRKLSHILERKIVLIGGIEYESPIVTNDLENARKGDKFANLPGSASEITKVEAICQADECIILNGKDATPQRVLEVMPGADVLHFATHGYCGSPRAQRALGPADGSRVTSERRVTPADRNPLLLSGIVLARASGGQTSTFMEAGLSESVLTADTISQLRLDKTKLAVLSACETAIGDPADGEGVFGLAQAFHISGVPNVIASLWRVDDLSTTALMSRFYVEVKSGSHRSPAAALRAAQLHLLKSPGPTEQAVEVRGRIDFSVTAEVHAQPRNEGHIGGIASHPKFWAGWVASESESTN